jgi:hypothetical protein
MTYNYYLQEQLAKAHQQELVHEVELQRLLAQVRRPQSSRGHVRVVGLVVLVLLVGLVLISVTLLPGPASPNFHLLAGLSF